MLGESEKGIGGQTRKGEGDHASPLQGGMWKGESDKRGLQLLLQELL